MILFCLVADVAGLDHAVKTCSVLCCRVVAVSQHSLRPAVHIVNIDFDLK